LGPLAKGLEAVGGFGNTEAVKRAVRAGRGISLVLAAAVADEVKAGQLVALPLTGLELAKELKIIAPIGLPNTAPATRFVAHALRDARLMDDAQRTTPRSHRVPPQIEVLVTAPSGTSG
jgi:DNA-binding transcriptional LysR family regulator